MSFEELVSGWNGFFKDKVIFSYVRCARCSMVYAPTFFNPAQLTHLYGQMPPNMAEVPLDALRRTQAGYFDSLAANSPLTGTYLEVGPDIGLFTQYCVQRGTFSEFWLFEPNRAVHEVLKTTVKDREAHIIDEMFGFSRVPDGQISAAVMVHVLDHLLDPVSTLRELRAKLKADARVLVVTHSERSLLRYALGWKWPAFCLQHPQVYNPESITSLFDQAGFRVERIERTTNHFQLDFLVRHLFWALGWKAGKIPALNRISLGLKLGNILTIASPRT